MALPPERPVLLRRAGSCATVLALSVLSAVLTLSRCPCSLRFPPFTFIPFILALSREELYCPTYLFITAWIATISGYALYRLSQCSGACCFAVSAYGRAPSGCDVSPGQAFPPKESIRPLSGFGVRGMPDPNRWTVRRTPFKDDEDRGKSAVFVGFVCVRFYRTVNCWNPP